MPKLSMLDEKTIPSSPSDEGLVVNIIRFSRLLRENGISVTLSSVLDAIRGLEFIDISNPDLFRGLLRPNFVHRKVDIDLFDQLFFLFWFSEQQNSLQLNCYDSGDAEPEADGQSEFEKEIVDYRNDKYSLNETSDEWVACYSPDALNRICKLPDFKESRELYESIKKCLSPLRNRLSRRSRYTPRGKEITLRRILRKNMQFGGELILLDFKKKKIKKRRIIFLCDVSGSMNVYTMMLLQFAHALKQFDHRTEIFFFSTNLSRWTNQFHVGDYSNTLSRLPELVSDWGGGTRIGHCLKDFNEIYGGRMLSSKTILLIFSDGWDRGETHVLKHHMAYLKNKSHKIIWLNPLIGTKDYQPICRGMNAALPYVDYFLPLGNARDLHSLGLMLEKMIV
jgi:uncharacterized protein with von Willebrand factor type A (vWA) domain